MEPEQKLVRAYGLIREARDELGLHPQWDGKLAEAEINTRGVVQFLDENTAFDDVLGEDRSDRDERP